MENKPRNRKQLLFKNGVYSVLSWLIPVILGFVVTPIVVRGLGNEAYGLYAVIVGFISYSFSLGIGKTASKYVAEYRAAGEPGKISETISSILWISLAFGLMAVSVIFLSAHYLVASVLLISEQFQETAVIAMYLAGLTILITMISQIFQYVLQGLQRFDLYLILTNLTMLLLNLGSVALVYRGYGVVELVGWNALVLLAVGILFYINARRLLPEFELKFSIKPEVWRGASKYALSIVLYQSFGNILLLFERGWIMRKFGAEALTYYVVPMTLCFFFHGFITSLSIVLFPVVNEFLSDRETLVKLYRTSSKVVLTLTAFFIVTSFFEGRVFLDAWMKGNFGEASYTILLIHVSTFSIICITTVAWQVAESLGHARLNAIATVVWLIISVPLMVVFSTEFQTPGVAFARFVGVFALVPLIVYVEKALLGGVSVRFWIETPVRLILAGAAAGFVEWLVMRNLAPGWTALCIAGLAGVASFMTSLYFVRFFDTQEREYLSELLMKFRR